MEERVHSSYTHESAPWNGNVGRRAVRDGAGPVVLTAMVAVLPIDSTSWIPMTCTARSRSPLECGSGRGVGPAGSWVEPAGPGEHRRPGPRGSPFGSVPVASRSKTRSEHRPGRESARRLRRHHHLPARSHARCRPSAVINAVVMPCRPVIENDSGGECVNPGVPAEPDPHHPSRPLACSAGRPPATHEDRCRPAFLGQGRGHGDRRCGAVGHELTVCRRAAGVHHALGIRSWSKWVTFSRSGNPPAATAPRASLHRVVGGRQSHPLGRGQ